MDPHLLIARELFNHSPFDESKCKELQVWGKDKESPVIKGYYAAVSYTHLDVYKRQE